MDEILWNCPNKDIKFLQLLLQHGGNANSVEQGKRQEGNTTRYKPLLLAVFFSLEKTKLLVEAVQT